MVYLEITDHTIAKGLSLKFATSGGLGLEAQWAGRQSEGFATAFALHYSWVHQSQHQDLH